MQKPADSTGRQTHHGHPGAAMTHRIVFLDRSTLQAQVRRPAFEHTWQEYPVTALNELPERLRDATIAITNKVSLRAETLQRLPKLKMIAVAATGYDVIDIAYCKANGIAVANIRNYAVHTVPEHAFTLITALRRNLLAYRRDVENGRWQQVDQFCFFDHPIRDLYGATLGILGEGALGQGTARIARAFGMNVLFADHAPPKAPGVVFTPLDQVLAESDVISLHLPLTNETRNMIGIDEFRKMKRSAILINTARGGLVDEQALVQALQQGLIAGAGFDVLTNEPPKQGNPLLELRLPNFILTPHIAWASDGAMQFLADQLIDNIEAFVMGKPQNLVT
jgi:glycerate dehydrogenase